MTSSHPNLPARIRACLAEGLEAGGTTFTHRSTRTLHVRHTMAGGYPSPSSGPADNLFLTDLTLGPVSLGAGQQLWVRQLNIEGARGPKIDDHAGVAWILGLKTEDEETVIYTTGGGKTELLGHLHVAGPGSQPRFITTDSSFSAAIVAGTPFPITAVETRGDETCQAEDFDHADLYAAHPRQKGR